MSGHRPCVLLVGLYSLAGRVRAGWAQFHSHVLGLQHSDDRGALAALHMDIVKFATLVQVRGQAGAGSGLCSCRSQHLRRPCRSTLST